MLRRLSNLLLQTLLNQFRPVNAVYGKNSKLIVFFFTPGTPQDNKSHPKPTTPALKLEPCDVVISATPGDSVLVELLKSVDYLFLIILLK